MPKYRIISEVDPGPDHREPRGERLRLDEARLVTDVEAGSLAEAAGNARDTEPHRERRIVSVEEIHPGFTFSDEQITAGLTSPAGHWTDRPMIDPAEFTDDKVIFGDGDCVWTVHAIAEALRDSGLVPGLHLSLLQNNEGWVDYSMIEIRDDARDLYLSVGAEPRDLTDDGDAAGWNGVLAVARELISISNHLH